MKKITNNQTILIAAILIVVVASLVITAMITSRIEEPFDGRQVCAQTERSSCEQERPLVELTKGHPGGERPLPTATP